jgi:hypothetical protein
MHSRSQSDTVGVIACGALTVDIDAVARRRGWSVRVHPLPPSLHNRPNRIGAAIEQRIEEIRPKYSRIAIAYADCGSYGAVGSVCDKQGIPGLEGNHCYDLYAGADAIAQLSAEDPGTYFLTDFLVVAFDKVVWSGLSLDRFPELLTDFFGNYHRVVWLAAKRTPDMERVALRAAAKLGLPLEIRDVSGPNGHLERALESLFERTTSVELQESGGASA